jgi:hypothetical protein
MEAATKGRFAPSTSTRRKTDSSSNSPAARYVFPRLVQGITEDTSTVIPVIWYANKDVAPAGAEDDGSGL